jgi:hypothetical protein
MATTTSRATPARQGPEHDDRKTRAGFLGELAASALGLEEAQDADDRDWLAREGCGGMNRGPAAEISESFGRDFRSSLPHESDLRVGGRRPVEEVVVLVAQVKVEEGADVGAFDADRAQRVKGADHLGDLFRGESHDGACLRVEDLVVGERGVRRPGQHQLALPAALVVPELVPAGILGSSLSLPSSRNGRSEPAVALSPSREPSMLMPALTRESCTVAAAVAPPSEWPNMPVRDRSNAPRKPLGRRPVLGVRVASGVDRGELVEQEPAVRLAHGERLRDDGVDDLVREGEGLHAPVRELDLACVVSVVHRDDDVPVACQVLDEDGAGGPVAPAPGE